MLIVVPLGKPEFWPPWQYPLLQSCVARSIWGRCQRVGIKVVASSVTLAMKERWWMMQA